MKRREKERLRRLRAKENVSRHTFFMCSVIEKVHISSRAGEWDVFILVSAENITFKIPEHLPAMDGVHMGQMKYLRIYSPRKVESGVRRKGACFLGKDDFEFIDFIQ